MVIPSGTAEAGGEAAAGRVGDETAGGADDTEGGTEEGEGEGAGGPGEEQAATPSRTVRSRIRAFISPRTVPVGPARRIQEHHSLRRPTTPRCARRAASPSRS